MTTSVSSSDDVCNDNTENMKAIFKSNRHYQAKPDLKLAESYLPALFLWIKGMLYTTLCLSIQYTNKDDFYRDIHHNTFLTLKVIPILALYYDHIVTGIITNHDNNIGFIDSTSFSVDIVAATIATQLCHLDIACSNFLCISVAFLWCIFGACHVYYFSLSTYSCNTIKHICFHIPICVFILCIFIFHDRMDMNKSKLPLALDASLSGSHTKPRFYFTYFARSTTYLFFVVIDAYVFRLPTQRDRDRMCTLRYGSILFSPASIMGLHGVILLGIQCFRIFQNKNMGMDNNSSVQDKTNNEILSEGESSHFMHGSSKKISKNCLESGNSVIPFTKNNQGGKSCSMISRQYNIPSSGNHVFSSTTLKTIPPPTNNTYASNNIVGGTAINIQQGVTNINYDHLDMNEAFRLAKQQYSDSKANV